MSILKQGTAATIKLGPFVDDADGKTAETGLTISQADIRLSKNGGDFAQTHNAAGATADELGYYDVPLDTTDTDTLGRLRVAVSETGALPVWQDFIIVTANVYDSLFSTDKLDVDVSGVAAAVWAYANRTLSSFGTLISSIWAWGSRTLTGFTTTEFHVIGPVRNDGKIDALAGDDYYAADGRGMVWSDTAWPDLTGATVNFISGSTTIAMSVVTAGSGEQTVNLDVPKATSAAMKGEFKFIIQATLTNAHVVTLLEGEGKFK